IMRINGSATSGMCERHPLNARPPQLSPVVLWPVVPPQEPQLNVYRQHYSWLVYGRSCLDETPEYILLGNTNI
ncbi:unnamed protein product, partial [Ceratitis capitata]